MAVLYLSESLMQLYLSIQTLRTFTISLVRKQRQVTLESCSLWQLRCACRNWETKLFMRWCCGIPKPLRSPKAMTRIGRLPDMCVIGGRPPTAVGCRGNPVSTPSGMPPHATTRAAPDCLARDPQSGRATSGCVRLIRCGTPLRSTRRRQPPRPWGIFRTNACAGVSRFFQSSDLCA